MTKILEPLNVHYTLTSQNLFTVLLAGYQLHLSIILFVCILQKKILGFRESSLLNRHSKIIHIIFKDYQGDHM